MQVHISAKLDGELSEIEAASLSKHLAECSSCAVVALDIRKAAEILRVAPRAEPRATFAPPHRTHLGSRRWALAAAVMATVAVLGATVAQHGLRSQLSAANKTARPAYFDSVDYEQRLIAAARDAHKATRRAVVPA